MSTITTVIITQNEQRNIRRCIESTMSVSDEVIVVDAFSTDETVNICTSLGAKVYQRQWDDFSSQKNYADSMATSDYILSIDADEALSQELVKAIEQIKLQNGGDEVYELSRLTYFCGYPIRHCGWYPDAKVRIFPRLTTRWEGLVHEKLKFEERYKVVRLRGDLYHYTITDLSQQIGKIVKYSDFRIQADIESGKTKKPSLLKILIKPCVKFLSVYVVRLGFLDGFAGFVVALNSAFSRFYYLSKLRMINTNIEDNG